VRYFLLITVLLVSSFEAFCKKQIVENTMRAKAYLDKEKTKLIYTEQHIVKYKNGNIISSITKYKDTDGDLIAVMKANYEVSLQLPVYEFHDFRLGHKEGLRRDNGKYIIFYQEEGGQEELNVLDKTLDIYAAQGWHYFISKNLDNLNFDKLVLNLVFPSRLDYYRFRLRKNFENKKKIKIILEFDSWFFRLFLPSFELVYSKSNHSLISYFGPSNILTLNSEIQNVYIVYE
jgi:hypothetical protein